MAPKKSAQRGQAATANASNVPVSHQSLKALRKKLPKRTQSNLPSGLGTVMKDRLALSNNESRSKFKPNITKEETTEAPNSITSTKQAGEVQQQQQPLPSSDAQGRRVSKPSWLVRDILQGDAIGRAPSSLSLRAGREAEAPLPLPLQPGNGQSKGEVMLLTKPEASVLTTLEDGGHPAGTELTKAARESHVAARASQSSTCASKPSTAPKPDSASASEKRRGGILALAKLHSSIHPLLELPPLATPGHCKAGTAGSGLGSQGSGGSIFAEGGVGGLRVKRKLGSIDDGPSRKRRSSGSPASEAAKIDTKGKKAKASKPAPGRRGQRSEEEGLQLAKLRTVRAADLRRVGNGGPVAEAGAEGIGRRKRKIVDQAGLQGAEGAEGGPLEEAKIGRDECAVSEESGLDLLADVYASRAWGESVDGPELTRAEMGRFWAKARWAKHSAARSSASSEEPTRGGPKEAREARRAARAAAAASETQEHQEPATTLLVLRAISTGCREEKAAGIFEVGGQA